MPGHDRPVVVMGHEKRDPATSVVAVASEVAATRVTQPPGGASSLTVMGSSHVDGEGEDGLVTWATATNDERSTRTRTPSAGVTAGGASSSSGHRNYINPDFNFAFPGDEYLWV